jgi:hypothetical protein
MEEVMVPLPILLWLKQDTQETRQKRLSLKSSHLKYGTAPYYTIGGMTKWNDIYIFGQALET